jgi:POT family proton-dependent oligopeptide transporter
VSGPVATTALAEPARAPPEGTWLGHPKGLSVLFLTEMWERMSYYGMRSLLVLYMVNHLLARQEIGADVVGLASLRHALESAFGPLGPQALSSHIYGLYTGFVYLTPIFGGYLADRVIGRRKAVIVGGALMALGHFLMAIESMFLIALMVLIVGNGCFKPNIVTQVGGLYAPGDPRRDRAFSVFYVGVNLGAFLAPLVCGTLGQLVGWHYGFAAAGVGMVLGLAFYVLHQDKLPVEPPPEAPPVSPVAGVALLVAGVPVAIVALLALLALPPVVAIAVAVLVVGAGVAWMLRLPHGERAPVLAIAAACLVTTAFWAAYEQQGNTLQLWADQSTRWPTVAGFTIPSTWYQSFNPFLIFLIVPLLNLFWAAQARRGREPTSLGKMAIGCVLLGAGFVVMFVAARDAPAGAQQSVLWLVAATAVFTLGELYLSPVGLSFVTKVAPMRMVSMIMGAWFLANFAGNYLSGYLGSFYEKMPHSSFFLSMSLIGVVAGAILFALNAPLDRIVGARDRQRSAAA